MASATPWPSSLCCRPLSSRSRFPTSVRFIPISTRALSMPASASASATASASFTAVKPENVQRQREGPQDLDDSEDETANRYDYGNISRCRGPYNVQIFVDENESEDAITDRFRREVYREGIIQECRRRRYHETRQDIKKRKSKEALRRMRHDRARRALKRKLREEEEDEDDETDDEDDEDDNWQLPEEEIGF